MPKKSSKSRKLSVYSNLSKSKKGSKNAKFEKIDRYIASLPKFSFKRIAYKFNPRKFAQYWFSKKGAVKALKILGVFILVMCLIVGGLFAYFRKDIDSIRPGEMDKTIQSTVNKYYDRNGNLLWEDKGDGNYKLVVDSKDISLFLKQATVAIEDKDFYKHKGVSLSGLARAVINNVSGGGTQGGSTLTQQLVKQVFFADEAQKRGLNGIPRKIKEVILAIEVERMYNKDQILTLYLNESPYGGRRNGAESGAQTYFGKSAKDLTLAEAALLAAIPQNPTIYNHYNIDGHEGLVSRQHSVLDGMVKMKYITQAQADEAKKYPILDHINPESDQYTNIKGAHFVQMVRASIEKELGKSVVGKGGLTITTTLDLRIQNKLEESMNEMFTSYVPNWAGFSNGASTVEDTKTGQIIALVGSRDFNYPGFGQDNATTASIQPGSTIKPLVYATLFQKKPTGQLNFGSGSILKDENVDAIYGAKVLNADHAFKGDITIRTGLAGSRNIPAIKAMYISGVKTTINTIHSLGAASYCTNGDEVNVGLAAAIGGCGVELNDQVNGYASLARMGVYKPQTTILEIKNSNGEVLKKWVDKPGKQVVDPQAAYIVVDILGDPIARQVLYQRYIKGIEISGVRTGTKTGTSDKNGQAKDIWMMSFSPSLVMGVWLGNSDATILKNGTSMIPGSIVDSVMKYAHNEIYAKEGQWKVGDWFSQPAGIQKVGSEVYPSWWNKDQGKTDAKLVFDKVSKKKATALTPEAAKIELDVVKTIDPVTKKDIYVAPDGYDGSKDDDVHKETDVKPNVSVSYAQSMTNTNVYTINASVTPGTFAVTNVQIKIDDVTVITIPVGTSYSYDYTVDSTAATEKTLSVSALVTDDGYYTGTAPATPMTVKYTAPTPVIVPIIKPTIPTIPVIVPAN